MLVALRLIRPALHAALAVVKGGTPDPEAPLAVGPTDERMPYLGDVSPSASAHGLHTGMRLAEALVLCPGLRILPANPTGERHLFDRLQVIAAGHGLPFEILADGVLLADPRPVVRLHGGLLPVLERLGRELPDHVLRIGAAPTRFSALQAATATRRRPHVVESGQLVDFLSPLPVERLHVDGGIPADVCSTLVLVGIDRLGGLASLDPIMVRDRFGPAGLAAHAMACGRDGRDVVEHRSEPRLTAHFEPPVPITDAGALQAALRLLIERCLADPLRRERAPRRLLLTAALSDGAYWSCAAALREPICEWRRLFDALLPKAERLPGPAGSLELELADLAAETGQTTLFTQRDTRREGQLAIAIEQVRATVGRDGLTRIVPLDPDSRLPEHRYGLLPMP
jgi:protein ImuB